VILEAGHVVQTGALADITARPRSPWVAELVGVNLLAGTAAGDRVALDGGGELVAAGAGRGPVVAIVHPHSVTLHSSAPTGSARNVWPGAVENIEPLGDRVRVRVAGAVPLTAEITPAALADLGIAPGADVWTSVKATDVTVDPA
jgi:molybdate transport system ATP-binding protein